MRNLWRNMRQRLLLLIGMLVILIWGVGGVMAQSASWTVLVFIEGDNNLEGDALTDIQEMEIIGSSDDVNIVVQIDRAEDYSAADGDWTEARRYRIEQNPNSSDIVDVIIEKFGDTDLTTLGTKHLESLGETNNGDPQTLIDFAAWAVETYPADKYALILWDHGGTWIGGFGGDESTEDHDGMNLVELDEALSTITSDMGQNFEFIGFDTCLMAGYEVFAMLSQYANYGAASEELEPGFGWYYTPIVDTLVSDPSVDGSVFSQAVVSGYMNFYDELGVEIFGEPWFSYSDQPYGQTAVDFGQMAALNDALSQFSEIAIANMDADLISAIGDARNNAQMFMLSDPDESGIYGSTDLKHFMDLLQRFSSNVDVNAAAQAVINAVDAFVLDHQATGLDGAQGVSIYFPANQRLYQTYGLNERYLAEAPYMSDWVSFLEAFYGQAIAEAVDNENSITISNVYQTGEIASILYPPTLVIDTVGTDIVDLSFSAILVLDDGTEYMIDSSTLSSATITEDGEELTNIPDGASSTQFTWGVDMPIVTDGETYIDTVLLETGEDETVVVTGDYVFSNGDSVPASIIFDTESQQASSFWGVNASETGGQPFEITTRKGEIFIPDWRYFDEAGDIQLQSTGVELVIGDEPFRYDYAPAESGNYSLYVFMTDIAGNVFYDVTQVAVDNDGLDVTYRGVADVNFGYNAIYPFDWYGALDIEADDGTIRTEYASNDGRIVVYFEFYEATTLEEMDAVATDYLGNFAIESYDTYEITIGGYDGYEISYYSETEDGDPINGVIAYTTVPDNAIGYLIDYTVFDGDVTDEDWYYYADLVNFMTFFPPLDDTTSADGGGVDMGSTMGTDIEDLLTENGITVAEFDDFFAEDGYTVADLQAEIDAGTYTIEQFEADFLEEE